MQIWYVFSDKIMNKEAWASELKDSLKLDMKLKMFPRFSLLWGSNFYKFSGL